MWNFKLDIWRHCSFEWLPVAHSCAYSSLWLSTRAEILRSKRELVDPWASQRRLQPASESQSALIWWGFTSDGTILILEAAQTWWRSAQAYSVHRLPRVSWLTEKVRALGSPFKAENKMSFPPTVASQSHHHVRGQKFIFRRFIKKIKVQPSLLSINNPPCVKMDNRLETADSGVSNLGPQKDPGWTREVSTLGSRQVRRGWRWDANRFSPFWGYPKTRNETWQPELIASQGWFPLLLKIRSKKHLGPIFQPGAEHSLFWLLLLLLLIALWSAVLQALVGENAHTSIPCKANRGKGHEIIKLSKQNHQIQASKNKTKVWQLSFDVYSEEDHQCSSEGYTWGLQGLVGVNWDRIGWSSLNVLPSPSTEPCLTSVSQRKKRKKKKKRIAHMTWTQPTADCCQWCPVTLQPRSHMH